MASQYWFRVRLREEMERQGISQRQIARACGTGASYINRVLSGELVPSLTRAEQLAAAVHRTLPELLRSR